MRCVAHISRLAADADALYEAATRFIRCYQFRDRDQALKAGLTVAHPGGLRARGRDTGYATGARCGGHSASQWQGGDSRGAQELPLARSADTGTPTLAVSHAHG